MTTRSGHCLRVKKVRLSLIDYTKFNDCHSGCHAVVSLKKLPEWI